MATFDRNKYKQIFESRYGPGSYESGLSNAREIGRLKAQSKIAEKAYNERQKAAERAAKAAKKAAQKQDETSGIFDGYAVNDEAEKQLQEIIANPKKQGAYRNAEKIKNDPSLQSAIKARGWTVKQFTDAMYNAATGGQFKSERDFNSFNKQLKKDTKTRNKKADEAQQAINGLTVSENYDFEQQMKKSNSQKKEKKKSFIGNAFDKFKKTEIGAAAKAAEDFFNPFDSVKGKDAVNNYLNRNRSKAAEEVSRGMNRVVDSASLGLMSNLDKRLNNRQPYYNSSRKIGEGGGTDMITTGLGYLIPGIGTAKALRGTALGANMATKGLPRALQLAKEGAATGALMSGVEIGIREGLNPQDYNWKQNLTKFGTEVGAGLVVDPAIYGLGRLGSKGVEKGLQKLIPGDLPKFNGQVSNSLVDRISPITRSADDLRPPSAYRKDFTPNSYNMPNGKNVRMNADDITSNIKSTSSRMEAIRPKVEEYKQEFDTAVEQQYQYLKNSMGKGVDTGTTSNGLQGNFREVTGRYTVSNNPKWYQDFYAQYGRRPNDSELRQLATEHVRNGFSDEFGTLPAWKPQAVQEIDDQIDELVTILKEEPTQEPAISPIVQALEQERNGIMDTIDNSLNEFNTLQNRFNQLKNARPEQPQNLPFQEGTELPIRNLPTQGDTPTPQLLRAGRDFEPIEQAPKGYNGEEPDLIQLSAKERADELINAAKANKNFNDLPDTTTQLANKTKERVPFKQKANQAYIDNVDNEYRLKQFSDDARSRGEVKPDEDPYMLALNSRGADQVSKQIVIENMVNHKGKVVGKSLKDISKGLSDDEMKAIEDYAVNKHAITRMQRGEKVFDDSLEMTPEKSAEKVAQYEIDNPEIAKKAAELYEFDKKLAETWLVDTGVLPKDAWEGYLENNPYYISNERLFSEIEKANSMNQASKGLANQSNPIKKGVGSQRKIISPMETRIERVAKYVKTAKRNETMQALIKQLEKSPDDFKGWAEIVSTDKNANLGSNLETDGLESVLDDFNKAFDQKPDLTRGNVIIGIVDGKKVHVKVNDPQLLEALTNLQPIAQEGAIKAIGQVTRMMKTLTTGINPMFSLLRNVWRDIPQSYIASKSTNNPIKFTYDLVESMIDVFGNREAYKAFKSIGGGHSSPISSDVDLLAQSKRAILGTKGLKSFGDKAMSGIENLSNIVEAAPRLAEFKRLTKNDSSYAAKVKGLYEANDITVNFNRFGKNVKQLDTFIPYLNAAVQGLDKFGRIYKDNLPVAAAKTALGITIPTMAVMAWNYNNDWENYKKLPSYVRDTNLLISMGDGEFLKIPRPREIGVIFGALPERMMLAFADEDPKSFEGYMDSLKTAFFPPTRLINAAFSDVRANKNFSDTPIVNGSLEGLSPRYQYDERTSGPAKWLGDKLNLSPKELDYIFKSYTGVIGQLAIPATAKGSNLGETFKRQIVSDSVYQNNEVDRFYNLKNKLDTAAKDKKAVGANSEYYNPGLQKQFNKITDNMSNTRKQMKEIEKNDSMTDKEKLTRLRSLQKIINDMASQGNQIGEQFYGQ